MLNIIYHKTYKESGFKRCVDDETYKSLLDSVEWFSSPALINDEVDNKSDDNKSDKIKEKIVEDIIKDVLPEEEEILEPEEKKRGRPKVKKE